MFAFFLVQVLCLPHTWPATSPATSAALIRRPVGRRKPVELLRFVTAYGTGMEAAVDITPYSTLLEVEGKLQFYAFIDTWVDNRTGRPAVYMNNVSHRCTEAVLTTGNGWSVTATLMFWTEQTVTDTRPKSMVTILSGLLGRDSDMEIGGIFVQGGRLTSKGIKLQQSVNFNGVVKAVAYACPNGVESLKRAATIGYAVRAGAAYLRKNDSEALDQLLNDAFATMLLPQLRILMVNASRDTDWSSTGTVEATYDRKLTGIAEGTPVYFGNMQVFIDTFLDGEWTNDTYPLKPAGQVVYAGNGTLHFRLSDNISVSCLPGGASDLVPQIFVPTSASVVPEALALVKAARRLALQESSELDKDLNHPLVRLLELDSDIVIQGRRLRHVDFRSITNLRSPNLLGYVPRVYGSSDSGRRFLPFKPARGAFSQKGDSVCVVAQKRQGSLFHRNYHLPQLKDGDRTVMQIVITGHGWADTTEQCGEFCHAFYQLVLNGEAMTNISQFRDDCFRNPIGRFQHGTWNESRNGWCPGSVQQGVFLDVTQWLRSGENHLSMNLFVWSEEAHEYRYYEDFRGFALGDFAKLTVSISVSVYDQAVVNHIRHRNEATTPAEEALISGNSNPDAVFDLPSPPSHAQDKHVVRAQPRRNTAGFVRRREDNYNFQAAAPWYLYNSTADGTFGGEAPGLKRLVAFDGALMQSTSRLVKKTADESPPHGWQRVALHLKLSGPPGNLTYDHWDREGSFGIFVSEHMTTTKHRMHKNRDGDDSRQQASVERELIAEPMQSQPLQSFRDGFAVALLSSLDVVLLLLTLLGAVALLVSQLPFRCPIVSLVRRRGWQGPPLMPME